MKKPKRLDAHVWEKIKNSIENNDAYGGIVVTKHNFRDRIAKSCASYKRTAVSCKNFTSVEKSLRYLRQDKLAPEKKLDLHGLRTSEAVATLNVFFQNAIRDKLKIVLVITGKGSGKIRATFLEWTKKQSFILSVHETDRKHGGVGAFYVFLRRKN